MDAFELNAGHDVSLVGRHCEIELASSAEIAQDYELNTARVIAESHPDPHGVPAALVAGHGPFTWGPTAAAAAENAIVLEEVAAMALHCLGCPPVSSALMDKHYFRKHGPGATYGQARAKGLGRP